MAGGIDLETLSAAITFSGQAGEVILMDSIDWLISYLQYPLIFAVIVKASFLHFSSSLSPSARTPFRFHFPTVARFLFVILFSIPNLLAD